jgi:ABC-type transport system substrate-binding protein
MHRPANFAFQPKPRLIPSEARNLSYPRVYAISAPLRYLSLVASPATRRSPLAVFFLLAALSTLFDSCSHPAPFTGRDLTFLIEANPVNLDPRYATDGQSQRLDGLIFSGLLARDAQMNLHGDLADSWQTPDPLTYIFNLKPNIRFHDGRPLTSSDVKSTFDFILNPANKSPKRGAFRMVDRIEAPDPQTVIFHLKEPYASFLVNLIPSAAGIVPANAQPDFARHPIGSGPFQLVSQSQDEDVQLIRNPNYFNGARSLSPDLRLNLFFRPNVSRPTAPTADTTRIRASTG